MIRLFFRTPGQSGTGGARSRASKLVASRWLAFGFLFAPAAFLSAQPVRQHQVPTIEAEFTRVFAAQAPTQLRFPSLSPDGRWILFSTSGTYLTDTADRLASGLWLLPASGGDPVPLLTQGGWDDGPVWFPSGDRIAFRSDRPARGGEGGSYIMSLAIDPETGRPTGPPRQVSAERCFAWLDVAPDGQSIVFTASQGTDRVVLTVPSVGGRSQTVADATPARPVWSPDGKAIYYDEAMSPGDGREALVRVSADGSSVDTVFIWPGGIDLFGYPQSRYVLRAISTSRDHPSVWEVATLGGQALGRLELPPKTDPFSFTPSGDLLAVRFDGESPLEVLPVEGGPPTRLNETGADDRVLGWSPDSHRVLFKTALDGSDRLFFAATDGGPMREVRLPEEPLETFQPVLSRDGRLLMYAVSGPESGRVTLKTFNLEQGDVRVVTEDFFLPGGQSFELSGRGGVHWRDGDQFLFVQRKGPQFDLRALSPSGLSRSLRTFDDALPYTVAVNGDRIAFSEDPRGTPDETRSLMLSTAGDENAHPILTVRGVLESITWSPDGRRLSVDAYRIPPGQDDAPAGLELLLLEIDSSGGAMGEPIVLDAPDGFWWWSPRWLPDGRALLVQGEDGNVWRISSRPGIRPVEVTEALPPNNEVWDFQISPDGRFMAYGRSIFRGSSIWRIGMGDALKAAGY
jgi:Tol biopolymer transport system component